MAKAVTLKNSNDEDVYPVTDVSLVNGGIYADTLSSLEPTTGYISTAMLQNNSVTPDKISTSTYTENEQEVGKWVDGKTLYRKVVTKTITSLPAADNTVAHNITGFDDLVELRVLFNLGWAPAQWASEGYLSSRGCTFRVDATNIHYENNSSSIANWTGTLVFVMEYTKSS